MEYICDLCDKKNQCDPDPSRDNAMPDNWHKWRFIDKNKHEYRILICPICTNALRQDYHFTSLISLKELENKSWLADLKNKVKVYISNL